MWCDCTCQEQIFIKVDLHLQVVLGREHDTTAISDWHSRNMIMICHDMSWSIRYQQTIPPWNTRVISSHVESKWVKQIMEQPEATDSLFLPSEAASLGRIGFKVRRIFGWWRKPFRREKPWKAVIWVYQCSSCLLFTADPRAHVLSLRDQKLSWSTTVHGTQFDPPVRR